MTTFTTTEIKNFPARTIVKIDGKGYSFLNEDVLSSSGDQITLSEKACQEMTAKITKDEKNTSRRARKMATARPPVSHTPSTLKDQLDTLSENYKAGSTMSRPQAAYIAQLASKAGDTMENIGWNYNSVISKNEADNVINQYLRG